VGLNDNSESSDDEDYDSYDMQIWQMIKI